MESRRWIALGLAVLLALPGCASCREPYYGPRDLLEDVVNGVVYTLLAIGFVLLWWYSLTHPDDDEDDYCFDCGR